MLNNEFHVLITPALLIVAGLFIKFSGYKKLSEHGKKYWLFFVIGGVLMLILRLSKLL